MVDLGFKDEIISYTDKTVNQFLGCTRARENTLADEHIAGQEAFSIPNLW